MQKNLKTVLVIGVIILLVVCLVVWIIASGGNDSPSENGNSEVGSNVANGADNIDPHKNPNSDQQPVKPSADVVWNAETGAFTLNVTVYNDQIVESVGYGYPSLYTFGGCDDTTEYEYDGAEFAGIVESGDAMTRDLPPSSPPDVMSYEIRRYNLLSAFDFYEGEVPNICFAVNYRDVAGQPLMQLIAVQKEVKLRGDELTEEEKLQTEKSFGVFIDSLDLTPLGKELVFGKYGFRIKYYTPDEGDLTFFWNDGFYRIAERTFYSQIKEIDKDLFTHELLHHVWHDYLSSAEKRALAIKIDEFFAPPYDVAEDEFDKLQNSLVFYANYYNPWLTEDSSNLAPHEEYEIWWQTAQKPKQEWRTSELHSMLATLVRELPPDLEEHYARFLNDRSSIVDYYWQAYYDWVEEIDREYDSNNDPADFDDGDYDSDEADLEDTP